MNEFGTVTLPIEEYHRLYDNSKELENLKAGLVKVDLNYNKEPQFQTHIPQEIILSAWDKAKEQYPDYVCSVRGDEDDTIYNGITKKDPPTPPELNLDIDKEDK